MRNVLTALLVLAASPAFAQGKEKLFATDLSVRTILAFQLPETLVQKLLPVGFEVNSPTTTAPAGSNRSSHGGDEVAEASG
jgi:hypothetical protein